MSAFVYFRHTGFWFYSNSVHAADSKVNDTSTQSRWCITGFSACFIGGKIIYYYEIFEGTGTALIRFRDRNEGYDYYITIMSVAISNTRDMYYNWKMEDCQYWLTSSYL